MLLRDVYEAFARGDVDRVLQIMDPDVEWPTPQGVVGEESYRGHSGVRRSVSSLADVWEHLAATPQRFLAEGDRVLAFVELRGRARRSGIELTEERAHLWTFRGDKAAKMEIYFDRAAALRALGESSRPPGR